MSVWESRKAEIQRMVDHEMTDTQIGFAYKVTASRICLVRKKLGIASKFTRKGKTYDEVFFPPVEIAPLVGEPFVDEQGRPGMRYPARWAAGALVQSVTARPRRG